MENDIKKIQNNVSSALYTEGFCDGQCSETDRVWVRAFWEELKTVPDEFWNNVEQRVKNENSNDGC
jgi:hypothetical protein